VRSDGFSGELVPFVNAMRPWSAPLVAPSSKPWSATRGSYGSTHRLVLELGEPVSRRHRVVVHAQAERRAEHARAQVEIRRQPDHPPRLARHARVGAEAILRVDQRQPRVRLERQVQLRLHAEEPEAIRSVSLAAASSMSVMKRWLTPK
jgi:hypothetical protein